MKKLLIVKTGSTFNSIKEKYGDFEDCIINQIGVPKNDIIVSSVYEDKTLPGLDDISSIIITGSHSMVTDNEDWSVMLSEWLKNKVKGKVPTLGICYGHQLLAHTFGGHVDYHPKGREFGTVNIELTEQGINDPLLGVLPGSFLGHVAHAQSAIEVPQGATVLARNDFEQHHAFVIHDNIWGVQFHPEFNAGVTLSYVEKLEEALLKEGKDVEGIKKSVTEHPYGEMLLRRFVKLAG